MSIIIAIGAIPTVLGLYCVLRGKIPFIKKYNGVKNISLRSIEYKEDVDDRKDEIIDFCRKYI